jgi:hypothetical protein
MMIRLSVIVTGTIVPLALFEYVGAAAGAEAGLDDAQPMMERSAQATMHGAASRLWNGNEEFMALAPPEGEGSV